MQLVFCFKHLQTVKCVVAITLRWHFYAAALGIACWKSSGSNLLLVFTFMLSLQTFFGRAPSACPMSLDRRWSGGWFWDRPIRSTVFHSVTCPTRRLGRKERMWFRDVQMRPSEQSAASKICSTSLAQSDAEGVRAAPPAFHWMVNEHVHK